MRSEGTGVIVNVRLEGRRLFGKVETFEDESCERIEEMWVIV